MPKQSINVSIDEDLLIKADEIIKANPHLNRSSFIQFCVHQTIKSLRGKDFVDVEI